MKKCLAKMRSGAGKCSIKPRTLVQGVKARRETMKNPGQTATQQTYRENTKGCDLTMKQMPQDISLRFSSCAREARRIRRKLPLCAFWKRLQNKHQVPLPRAAPEIQTPALLAEHNPMTLRAFEADESEVSRQNAAYEAAARQVAQMETREAQTLYAAAAREIAQTEAAGAAREAKVSAAAVQRQLAQEIANMQIAVLEAGTRKMAAREENAREARAEAEAQARAQARAEAEAQARAEARPEAEAQSRAEARAESEAQARAESRS